MFGFQNSSAALAETLKKTSGFRLGSKNQLTGLVSQAKLPSEKDEQFHTHLARQPSKSYVCYSSQGIALVCPLAWHTSGGAIADWLRVRAPDGRRRGAGIRHGSYQG
jgi:hypothetical protein